jgi:hypothetical protein
MSTEMLLIEQRSVNSSKGRGNQSFIRYLKTYYAIPITYMTMAVTKKFST